MADMDPILAFAELHGLFVVEDAAQAHGALYRGKRAGSLGEAGCFSFYPGKNLGAFGEAGGVATGNGDLANKIRLLIDHGQSRKYYHSVVGWNCRMDGIQAAILNLKLRDLERNNANRREIFAHYSEAFEGLPHLVLPATDPRCSHVHHHFVVRVSNRHKFMAELSKKGVASLIHYPIPVHLQEAYAHLGYRRGSFPIAERCAEEFVSLPIYPELSPSQIGAVIDAVVQTLEALLA
jgi:dTDP-4-amino-4,6-dideoxygalactose transaminase